MEANTTALNYGMGSRDWSFSDLSNYLMDSIDESSAASTSLNMNESARFPQDEYLFSRETQIKSIKRANENQMFSSSFETSTDPTHIGYVETKPNHLVEEIWPWTHFVGNEEKFGETSYGLSSYSDNNITGHVNVKNFNDFSSVPSVSAFDKAAGLVDYRETGKCIPEYILNEDTFSSSTLISNKKEHDDIKSFELPEGLEPEYLLDAVVGDLYSASDETSCRSNSFRSHITMTSEFTGSIQPKITSEESTAFEKNSDVGNGLIPAVTTNAKDVFMNHIISSFDGNSSLLVDEAPREQVNNHVVPISRPKLSSVSKKKSKVGNKKNSRPRDRQLIMDRMKELRELIPDGGRVRITFYHQNYMFGFSFVFSKLFYFVLMNFSVALITFWNEP